MYENGCEFLRNEIDKNELKLKKKFEDDIPYTEKWWKKKAVKRYTNVKEQGRIKPDSLFYWDVIDMDWESTKNNYLKDVGR